MLRRRRIAVVKTELKASYTSSLRPHTLVDAEDKANVYRTWAGLMKGSLKADMGGGKVRATSV
jgi:hypothetical protein